MENKILMIGTTPPEEGGSQMHIYEMSSKIPSCQILTQKGSFCNNKIELPALKKSVFLRNISFAVMCYLYMFKLLLVKKHDIIHIHENLLYFLAPFLRLRYKVVITVHGIKGFKFYDKKYLWFFFKTALKFANIIITVNQEDKKILDKYFHKVFYMPNGVDIQIYRKTKVRLEKKITFIGRIHEQKGIIYLLKAFESLKNSELKLEILGKINEYAIKLQKQFPDKRIIWKGLISDRKKKAKLLKSAYCIVLPSLWEGLPLTLFEALASGRPLIISSLSQIKSIVKDDENALLVKPADSDEIAGKILFLLNNPKKAEKIGKSGAILSENYSWDKISKNLVKIYQTII